MPADQHESIAFYSEFAEAVGDERRPATQEKPGEHWLAVRVIYEICHDIVWEMEGWESYLYDGSYRPWLKLWSDLAGVSPAKFEERLMWLEDHRHRPEIQRQFPRTRRT